MALVLEKVDTEGPKFLGIEISMQIYRAKVVGGWIIVTVGVNGDRGVAFYPDPNHEWDGNSLD